MEHLEKSEISKNKVEYQKMMESFYRDSIIFIYICDDIYAQHILITI